MHQMGDFWLRVPAKEKNCMFKAPTIKLYKSVSCFLRANILVFHPGATRGSYEAIAPPPQGLDLKNVKAYSQVINTHKTQYI